MTQSMLPGVVNKMLICLQFKITPTAPRFCYCHVNLCIQMSADMKKANRDKNPFDPEYRIETDPLTYNPRTIVVSLNPLLKLVH